MRDTLHHVAVAANCIDPEVDQILEAWLVVVGGQPPLGDGHADRVRHALPQRPGRRLDARGEAIFGMPGALAVQLPELLDVVERDRGRAEAS